MKVACICIAGWLAYKAVGLAVDWYMGEFSPQCWWFGCLPDYDAVHYNSLQDMYTEPPCKRCGARWVSYSDCVGDNRHARAKDWLSRHLTPKPRKRPDEIDDDVPF